MRPGAYQQAPRNLWQRQESNLHPPGYEARQTQSRQTLQTKTPIYSFSVSKIRSHITHHRFTLLNVCCTKSGTRTHNSVRFPLMRRAQLPHLLILACGGTTSHLVFYFVRYLESISSITLKGEPPTPE